VEEPAFAYPPLFLDQYAVHHGNLSGGPAEAVNGDLDPDPESLGEGYGMGRIPGFVSRPVSASAAHSLLLDR
jgi:hypothetical protein